MRIVYLSLLLLFTACATTNTTTMTKATPDLSTPHERNPNTTATYYEAVDFYEKLADTYPQIRLVEYGKTDIGKPLHLVVFSADNDFDAASLRNKNKRIILINNGIHPGEPCGVDASMMLLRDYALDGELPENIVLAVIPVYNIGGAINRNAHTRANQDGPESYGFRGNARNLDLNRDFVKADSRNAQAFTQIYHEWQPDIFIDNHTSNGADYQYTMTMIATQHNKLESTLGKYLNDDLMPQLYADMKARNWEMTPYVYARTTPDEGIIAFLDLPRYSSGYTTLFNTIGFIPETHMLKPFADRVASTRAFMESVIDAVEKDGDKIAELRRRANENVRTQTTFDINWELDTERVEMLNFKGYEAKQKPSDVSGLDRLYYDHDAPFEQEIPFLNNYKSSLSIEKPYAYIIPQAWHEVIERMKWNGVEMTQLTADKIIEGEVYFIGDFDTRDAYEGHYLHSNVQVEKRVMPLPYFAGDYIVKADQITNRYIIETLEPQAPDSWFAWNFFDSILMQKEHFSPYIFEDEAAEMLRNNPALKAELEEKKNSDKKFAESAYAQLNFIYKKSKHYEPTHLRYPVMRVINANEL